MLSIALMTACGPMTVELEDARVEPLTELPADDSADDPLDDTAGAVLEADLTQWQGSRRFYYDYSDRGYYCDETVEELGVELAEGSVPRAALAAACPACDAFYAVTPDREYACDWIELRALWRGVAFHEETADVRLYTTAYGDGGEDVYEEYARDPAAAFDGARVSFAYDFEWFSEVTVEVTGTIAFARADE